MARLRCGGVLQSCGPGCMLAVPAGPNTGRRQALLNMLAEQCPDVPASRHAGPNTGERQALLNMLAEEFPDVFAFPKLTTTRQPDEDSHHLAMAGVCGP
jgi:hypothetical protein